MKYKKAINSAYKLLGQIDKKHESGRISTKEHNRLSKRALLSLVRRVSKR